MSDVIIEIGASLLGVIVAALFLFKTSTGRHVAGLARERSGPGTNAMTLALVATVTAVIAQVLIKWIVSGWGLQWHEVVGVVILAVGLGAIFYGVYRAPSDGEGSRAQSRG